MPTSVAVVRAVVVEEEEVEAVVDVAARAADDHRGTADQIAPATNHVRKIRKDHRTRVDPIARSKTLPARTRALRVLVALVSRTPVDQPVARKVAVRVSHPRVVDQTSQPKLAGQTSRPKAADRRSHPKVAVSAAGFFDGRFPQRGRYVRLRQHMNSNSSRSLQSTSSTARFGMIASSLIGGVALLALTSLTGCGGGGSADSGGGDAAVKEAPPKEAIAMLYYADDSPFNAAFRAGAKASAGERKVELEWLDVAEGESQGAMVDRAVKEKYAAICVCPLEPGTLTDAVAKAAAAKIPVIVCERPLSLELPEEGTKMPPFVATDHAYCGQVLAEQATKVVDDGGKLLLIGGEIGVEADRAMNVDFALKKTKIKVVAESDVSTDGVAAVMNKFVEDNKKESIAVVAVSADGAKEVLDWKASEKGEDYQDLPLLGFGSWDGVAEAIKSGTLSAVVLEDPNGIGAAAVLTAATAKENGEVGDLVTTGEHLVTAENLDDDRTKDLLKTNVR